MSASNTEMLLVLMVVISSFCIFNGVGTCRTQIETQWNIYDGKCGICGDSFGQSHPRSNEAGGTYGKGIITRTYTQGQVIDVTVLITANHLGYFLFKICPNNNVNVEATQECLDANPLTFVDVNSGQNLGQRFYIDSATGNKYVKLQLPSGMTCTQCVMQWTYFTGNSWGCDATGCCQGCGPQENFVNCIDIAITGSSNNPPNPTTAPNTPAPYTQAPNTPAPNTPAPYTPAPTTPAPSTPAPNTPAPYTQAPNTPAPTTAPTPAPTAAPTPAPTVAPTPAQSGICRAVGIWKTVPGMDNYCVINCAAGYCPPSHCTCA